MHLRKKYILSIVSLSIMTLACCIWSMFSSSSITDANTLESTLNEELKQIKLALQQPSPTDIPSNTNLDENYHDIVIHHNDSLIYWNNYLQAIPPSSPTSEHVVIRYKDQKDGYSTMVLLDLTQNGKVSQLLYENGMELVQLHKKSDQNLAILDYKGKSYTFAVKNKQILPFSNTLGNIVSFFLLAILLLFLKDFFPKSYTNFHKISLGLLSLLACIALNYYLLSPSYFTSFQHSGSIFMPNLTFIFPVFIFVLFLFALLKNQIYQIGNGMVGSIVFPFTITMLFVWLIWLAKGFLLNNQFHFSFNEILQYKLDGNIYLITFLAIILGIFYISNILFSQRKSKIPPTKKYILWVIGMAFTIPISYYLRLGMPLWTLYTFVSIYLLLLELYSESKVKNIVFTFWWIIFFAGFLASITFYYRLKSSENIRAQKVQSMYTPQNVDHTEKVKNIDQFLKASDVFEKLSNLPYPSGLYKNDFTSYIVGLIDDKMSEIQSFEIEMVDDQGSTLFNNHYATSYEFNQDLKSADKISDHVFYHPILKSYLLNYKIENTNYVHSPLALAIRLSYYPSFDNTKNEDINYIIFKNDNIIERNLDTYNISYDDIKKIDKSGYSNDYAYTVYKPNSEIKIVAYDKIEGLIKTISLFSYIVSLSVMILFLLAIINSKYGMLPDELDIRLSDRSSLRTRIQLTIILLIIFSFVIIGIVTAFYFKNVLENNSNLLKNKEISSILLDIRNHIEGTENDYMATAAAQSRIDELAQVHSLDMILYNHQGTSLTASKGAPMLPQMPFRIVENFRKPGQRSTSNRIELPDKSTEVEYVPLYYSDSKPYGYLGLSFETTTNSGQSIKDFLSTILNVYIFLFLFAGALAIAIGNSITRPLSILSRKLKEFTLGESNQKLEWNSSDEIGDLIHEYNQLTQKLEESANIIAKTQRDMAWREMAKQVAHEIKNPLTPMKLSLQYLEKAIKDDPSNATAMISRVSSTLIEQINNLNQIADEFSNFGKMPKATNEKIIINEIVEAIHDLFRKRDDITILMSEPIHDMYVFADRNHLVRILNNIVKNAIQAIPNDREGKIQISLSQRDNMAVIAVTDNGTGIPDTMKDKVFTPNFTTKNSGTGLGLAISANMIETFNGKIYFETKVNVGTTFFVEIPLMRLQDNFSSEVRISLE